MAMADGSKDLNRQRNPADKLTEDLLVEILSRVPYRSLCRFKCVSKRWRGIISDPNHRKALPQYYLDDLAGFLYSSRGPRPDYLPLARNFTRVSAGGRLPIRPSLPPPAHNFTHVSARGRTRIRPSLPFLPDCELLNNLDSCNGLLLCRRFKTTSSPAFDYVVCNPATEKWVALPGYFSKMHTAHLGFDPAVSSYFHVFLIVEDDSDNHVKSIVIYSSETGGWSHKASGWGIPACIAIDSKSVFLNGFLHLVTVESKVVAVDLEGTTWRVIPMPYDENAPEIDAYARCIHLSQGCLYLAITDQPDNSKVSIWVLEDYDSQVWVLKHSIRSSKLFVVGNVEYDIVGLHPQRRTIFLVYGRSRALMSYEMDSGNGRFIHDLGRDSMKPYLPYVPLYSEALANWT